MVGGYAGPPQMRATVRIVLVLERVLPKSTGTRPRRASDPRLTDPIDVAVPSLPRRDRHIDGVGPPADFALPGS